MSHVPYQEYPKKMHHPQHEPAVWKKLEGKGRGLFEPDTVCTQNERYPDVTVTTLQQEQYYAAKGYRPNNVPDPQAYEQAILEAEPVDGYVYLEFPKWKYHAINLPVVVKSAEEEAALGSGWQDSPAIATEDDLIEAGVPVQAAAPAAADPAPIVEATAKPAPRAAAAVKAAMAGKAKTKAKPKPKKAPAPASAPA